MTEQITAFSVYCLLASLESEPRNVSNVSKIMLKILDMQAVATEGARGQG